MELKLVVSSGAKAGTKIPLKKDQVLIGRAKECALRVSSEAISRRHCLISRDGEVWKVRDLKSRNGTYLNDERLTQEMELRAGDELRIGPLTFQVEQVDAAPVTAAEAPPPATNADMPRGKQPRVKDVADAAQRTVSREEQTTEDDISRWLLDVPGNKTNQDLKETRAISMEETARFNRPAPSSGEGSPSDEPAEVQASSDDQATENGSNEELDAAEKDKSSGWQWLKRGKGSSKKKPGKLPQRSSEQSTKDSGEAAADLLREMTRRR